MQTDGYQFTAQLRSPPPSVLGFPAQVNTATQRDAAVLDKLELESLMFNVDASLRAHSQHQFFTWTQGLLQNLVKHDLLICARRNADLAWYLVESFATSAADPTLFSDAFRQNASLVPHLLKAWEENEFRPVICETGQASQFASDRLACELARIGADAVLAHGTYDLSGKVASFFIFACKSGDIGAKQTYLAELIVPFLHLAWTRVHVSRPAESAAASPSGTGLLTSREREILKWIYIGKSNIEIGAILEISPLTVKNHVQKILRKLNVRNRAQAVGRGLALRILGN